MTVLEDVESVPDTLKCDAYNHPWDEVDSLHWFHGPAVSYIEPVTLRCMRCGRERRDTVNKNTGEIVRRRYVPPPGYQKYKRNERPTKAEFRRMRLAQRIIEAREARKAAK